MSIVNRRSEEMEQTDYIEDDFLIKNYKKYSNYIGEYIIRFSYLEDEINRQIAEFVHDDLFEIGYILINKLELAEKIEVYFNCYLKLDTLAKKRRVEKLKLIKKELIYLNEFRNVIAHANWQTLDKDYYVRTQIKVDKEDGYVKTIKVEVCPRLIRKNINLAIKTQEEMFKVDPSVKTEIRYLLR